jgi:peptidoglycan biosynthesis protein MviN/MurJ (putative lipid II flippase)
MSAQRAPLAVILILGGYGVARLQARERFGFAAAEALPPIVLAVAVVTAPAGAGFEALVWGTVLGFALYLILLLGMAHASDRPLGAIRFRHRSAQWRTLYRGLLLMTLAQLLIAMTVPADQAFASRLGEGSVATLGYANRIISLITGLGTVVLARALLPVLSAAVADGQIGFARRQALQWSVLMFLLALVGAIIGWLLTPAAVTLLFQRGAFDVAAVDAVSTALRFGLLQLPPFFAGITLVQLYAASDRFRALLVVTAAALVVKLVLNAVLTPAFGVPGIMAATALMYATTLTMMALGLGTWRPPFRSAG